MTKDYGELWRNVTTASDDIDAVRILAEILLDKEGRVFASNLGRSDAEICIEILDYVRHDNIYHLPFVISNGRIRLSQSITSNLSRNRCSLSR